MSHHGKTIAHFFICVLVSALMLWMPPVQAATQRAEKYKETGNQYFKNHQYMKAIEAFTKAIEDEPDFNEAYFNRGLVYYDLELFYKAIVDFDMAIMLNPNDRDAYYARGLSYSKVNKLKLAMMDVQKASDMGNRKAKELLDSGELHRRIEEQRSKQKKINSILDEDPKRAKRESEVINVNNTFGGNTFQIIYKSGDPQFNSSEGVFRQLDFYDNSDMLKKTELFHTAAFIENNNRNKTTIFYDENLHIIKKEYAFTGKLLNHTGVFEYDPQGKLKSSALLDKFGRKISDDIMP